MLIKEISYFEIIKYLFAIILQKKHSTKYCGQWTRFQMVDVREVNEPLMRYQAEYINWSQSLLGKIDGFYELPMTERMAFLGSIIFTKYWRSAAVLASFSTIINILFAILYISHSSHFKGLSGKFLESLYFSVVTFTTLGYGDVTPSDDLGRILVILEVVIGYVTLGSFLFILGQKVSQRY
jgi:Ion channel